MTTQNVVESYVLAQTPGFTYNGNALDQTYSLNPNLIGAGERITIIDQGGDNRIELAAGLEIISSLVASNQTVLTLSNGAEVDIRGADTFTFAAGQNLAGGDAEGTDKNFTDFADDVLGAPVPSAGVAEGEAVTINDDGTANNGNATEGILVDQNLTAVDGEAETFIYNIDSSTGKAISLAGGDFTIDGFNAAEDQIIFQDVESGTLTESTFGDTTPTVSESQISNKTDFIFSDDANGNALLLTLNGVADQDLQAIDFSIA